MKKTQVKDALRNIGKNRMSWISIIFITAMAAAVYLGICFSATSMKTTGDDFYEETNFRDIELVSTLLLTQDDMKILKSDDDIKDIEGIYYTVATVENGNVRTKADVVSLSERINVPILLSGQLPKAADECALEKALADKLGYQVGDTVELLGTQDAVINYIGVTKYKITGIVNHPDHLTRPEYTPDNRYIMVTPEAFDRDALGGCCMKAEILLKSVEDLDRYSDEYKSKVRETVKRLEVIGSERAKIRTEEVRQQKETLTKASMIILGAVSAELEDEKQSLDAKKAEIEALEKSGGSAEAAEKLQQLREEYAESEKEYNEIVSKMDEAQKTITRLTNELDKMKTCRWFFFTAYQNAGYLFLSLSTDSILSLSVTFSLFFIFIAALVIYTTMGRIVSEQRKLVGVTKALGFYNREILGKYLIFGISATVIGALIGMTLGYFVIQGVVLNAYSGMFVVGELQPKIMIPRSLIIIFAAAALATLAVSLSCTGLMRSTAIRLMQEKEPKTRSGKGRKIGSLYSRLILRNMRSDLGRIIVTTVSVAGCCALLVTGFTMQHSAGGILNRQYGEIVRYDDVIKYTTKDAPNVTQEIEAVLDEAGAKYMSIFSANRAFRASEGIDYTELISGDLNKIAEFYGFINTDTGEPLSPEAEGVFIPTRTAETCGLKVGDLITLYSETMEPFDVRVAGIFDNYVGRNMVMSESSYASIFGKKPAQNIYILYRNGADREQLKQKLKAVKGFQSLETASKSRKTLEKITNVFNRVSLLMIAVAGLMAYFILLNIMKMYINRKKRELTVMRINGFTVGEVKRYILMETIFTTILGIILGIALGAVMGYTVLRFLEQPHLQFIREPYVLGWLIGAVITAVFTFAINAIGLRRIKHLNLSDASA